MRRPWLLAPPGRTAQRITAVVAAVVVLAGVVALVVPRLTALPDDAALRVDDTVVSRTELDRRTKLLASLYGINPPADSAGKDTFRRDTAKAIATSTVLDRAAAERGVVISDKVARDALTKMVDEQMGGQGGRGAYVKLLADAGASEADVLEEIKRQQATEQLFTQVASSASSGVTDADVRNYYRDHPAEMTTPEQRHLRNVVVASEAEAADVLRRVTSGEDPALVAQQSSLDQSTRAQGGDLGFVAGEQLDPSFAGAAFGAAPGALFGPVRSRSGWNVGQVLEVKAPVLNPFEQVAPQLNEKLRNDRALATWRGWMDQQIANADIDYADELRPPEAPRPAAMAPAGNPAKPQALAAAAPGSAPAPGQSFLTPLLSALVLAAALFGIGVWGRQNVDDLVPAALPEQRRAKKRRVLLRGTLFCMAGAATLLVLSMVGFVRHFL